jgi:hypothetical protein
LIDLDNEVYQRLKREADSRGYMFKPFVEILIEKMVKNDNVVKNGQE